MVGLVLNTWRLAGEEYLCWAVPPYVAVGVLAICAAVGLHVAAPVSEGRKVWWRGQNRGQLRAQAGADGGDGGEQGGAEEFDGAEGRAPGDEVHLVLVRAREQREAFRGARPGKQQKPFIENAQLWLQVFIHLLNSGVLVRTWAQLRTNTLRRREVFFFFPNMTWDPGHKAGTTKKWSEELVILGLRAFTSAPSSTLNFSCNSSVWPQNYSTEKRSTNSTEML